MSDWKHVDFMFLFYGQLDIIYFTNDFLRFASERPLLIRNTLILCL